MPSGLREVVAVAAGGSTSYALTADGRIVVWGSTSNGQGNVPAGSGQFVAIAAGRFHCLALREDGTVAAWGLNTSGQTTVPAGLNGVVAISAGTAHSLVLKSDGILVAWGDNGEGQLSTPSPLGTAVAMAAGSSHSLGLSSKGSVLEPEIVAARFAVAATSLPFWLHVPAKNSPTAYSATGLPDGVTIHPTTGIISGSPTMAGTYEVTLSATNTHGEGNAALTIYVNDPVPVILSSTAMVTLQGLPASYQITSNVACTSYAATNLPTGLTLDTTTGLISGTPVQKGTFAVELSAATAFGTATATLNLTVRPQLPDAVDAPALAWTSGGTAPWNGQTTTIRDGTDAAESGTITHSQESWLETSVTGPGTLTFWWKVSSQSGGDYLEFRINNVLQTGRISGTVDWAQQTHTIPEGTHALRWRYAKNGSTSTGTDKGWLDEVIWIRDGSFEDWLGDQPALDTPEKRHPLANPADDGINNLLKYAFNLDPALAISGGARTLTPGTGTSGLPVADTTGTGPTTRLRLEFIRRRQGGTVYMPQFSSSLHEIDWQNATGTPAVTSINDDWERVVIEDTVEAGASAQRFGRVRVTQEP